MLSFLSTCIQTILHFMPLWLLTINIITFFVYRSDKRRAIRKRWRIPERTLMFLALIGGSIGALAAMFIFRHKTRHTRFIIGVPVILLLHFSLYCLYLKTH